MKLEDQVVSLDLSKKLKELGVRQESLYEWIEGADKVWRLREFQGRYAFCSAFTVAELGERLIKSKFPLPHWNPKWKKFEIPLSSIPVSKTFWDKEAEARAKMLIYLIENKLMGVR